MNQLDATMNYWPFLHLVGSPVLLYLIDDARSNKNQVYFMQLFPAKLKLWKIIFPDKAIVVVTAKNFFATSETRTWFLRMPDVATNPSPQPGVFGAIRGTMLRSDIF